MPSKMCVLGEEADIRECPSLGVLSLSSNVCFPLKADLRTSTMWLDERVRVKCLGFNKLLGWPERHIR